MSNEAQNPNATKSYDLEEGTAQFAEKIIEFAKTLPTNLINNSLISQVVRSGTSVGANYMESDAAESKKDFRHKIGICRKESKETRHWLRMIAKAEPCGRKLRNSLLSFLPSFVPKKRNRPCKMSNLTISRKGTNRFGI